MVGAETAEYLADHHREVTIIEMLDRVADDMPRIPRPYLVHRLNQLGVEIITGAKVEAITDYGVLINKAGMVDMVDGFSSIVLALGSRPVDELADELKDLVEELFIVGDARQVARIAEATSQSAEAALAI